MHLFEKNIMFVTALDSKQTIEPKLNCITNKNFIMRRISQNAIILVLAVLLLSSCRGLNWMQRNADEVRYEVTPEVLEAHGGEVEANIKGTYPERYFHRNVTLELTPVINYEEGEKELSTLTLQGENVQDNYQVIDRDGDSFDYNDVVDFDEEMRVSDLELRITGRQSRWLLSDRTAEFDPKKLADGVIATSTLVVEKPKPVLALDQFRRIIDHTKESEIYYVINRWNVRQSELESDRVISFGQFLDEAAEDERINLDRAGIRAYASPDGPIDFNEDLSERRKETSNKVMSDKMEEANFEITENFYETRALGEDWEGFKEMVEESDIEDRELILRVLSMYSDPEVREEEIRNMAAVFEELAETILPKLRRAIMTVEYEEVGYSDDELMELFASDPGTLNLEELLYTATLYDDLNRQLEVYETAASNFPESQRAHNNVGYVQVKLENVQAAKRAFESAQNIEDDDIVRNNLGAVALLEGNIDEAEEYFRSVASPTSETNYNLGIISIIKGQYDDAEDYFGNAREVNTALAKLLNNKNDDALRILNQIDEPCAMTHYLKAIVGARTDDSDMLFDNLRTAVEMKGDLKELARTDMEFGNYFDDDTFISIVE